MESTSKGIMCTQSKTLMGCQEINCAQSNGRTFMCDGEGQPKLLCFWQREARVLTRGNALLTQGSPQLLWLREAKPASFEKPAAPLLESWQKVPCLFQLKTPLHYALFMAREGLVEATLQSKWDTVRSPSTLIASEPLLATLKSQYWQKGWHAPISPINIP